MGVKLNNERGAALVVVLLVILVLTGLGMVALDSTTEGVWLSSSHRTRAQATVYSDAVVQFGMYRAGVRAPSYAEMLKARAEVDLDALNSEDERIGAIRRGGYQIFTPEADPGGGQATLSDVLTSGQLIGAGSETSLEEDSEMPVAFRYIVRDPVDGPPAPGYSGQFCFKKVTIASEAVLGDVPEAEADRRRQRAMGRHSSEAMMGPIDCGSR
ncbi:hypothetical protein DL240_02310 [Lujinxingia litoralis]|uniref:Type 4 fimbrial biogenesis protein PilX N-terminal domain-containing protein n=1 Tax=Lujinxingia litoralis TaxID=2211119 RepID=A0A328CAQ4_9DELT|nr:hypothetical protein [Lujinxingia litoralis]RAL25068.1 hypothetical protein DL240_02310 [Lujinxingia litoralis]